VVIQRFPTLFVLEEDKEKEVAMFKKLSFISFLLMLIFALSYQACSQSEVRREDFNRLNARVEQLEKDISDLKGQVSNLSNVIALGSVPAKKPQERFRITSPKSGETVSTDPDGVIMVKGVGAVTGSKIEVSVKTDTWYPMDYNVSVNIDDDGAWTFSPCYLKGKGFYSTRHAIRARLTTPDGKSLYRCGRKYRNSIMKQSELDTNGGANSASTGRGRARHDS